MRRILGDAAPHFDFHAVSLAHHTVVSSAYNQRTALKHPPYIGRTYQCDELFSAVLSNCLASFENEPHIVAILQR